MMSGWPPAVWTTPLSFGMLANSQVDDIHHLPSVGHFRIQHLPAEGAFHAEREFLSAQQPCFFPEMVTCLRGHTGLVKGLTWDPVGKYIASQADDHSLRVWRTVDWQMEANITKPFSEVNKSTLALWVKV